MTSDHDARWCFSHGRLESDGDGKWRCPECNHAFPSLYEPPFPACVYCAHDF